MSDGKRPNIRSWVRLRLRQSPDRENFTTKRPGLRVIDRAVALDGDRHSEFVRRAVPLDFECSGSGLGWRVKNGWRLDCQIGSVAPNMSSNACQVANPRSGKVTIIVSRPVAKPTTSVTVTKKPHIAAILKL